MNKNEIMAKASRKLNRVGFSLKKHSPEILAVTGVVGIVASGVMACRATTKVSAILENKKEYIEIIHETAENKDVAEYTEEDSKKDLTIVYAKTGVELVKLYAPSVILGTLSITAMLASNNILRKRNIALGAAYATIDKSFKEYRNRVVDRFGEDLDKELRYNLKAKTIKETEVDEEGKKKTVKKTIHVADPSKLYSDFARIYDDGCTGWTKDPEANKMFLLRQQDYANERLKAKGHLFLNEVYDMLGFPRTQVGQVFGWIYDEKNPIGDNYVDFGIFNVDIEPNRDFVNGYERNIILDFNVDGNILELM